MDNLQKNQGMSPADAARAVGMTTTQLRAARSIAKNANKQADIAQALRLKDRGWSNVAIGERMGIRESSVRLLLNTNKNRSEAPNKLDALKPMKTDGSGRVDQDNPFGATIKPGGQRGVMNTLSEEGDWDTWSRSLSSQFLSKQSPTLAKQQLNMTFEKKAADLEEILGLSNPGVRRHLLEAFAELSASSAKLRANVYAHQD